MMTNEVTVPFSDCFLFVNLEILRLTADTPATVQSRSAISAQ